MTLDFSWLSEGMPIFGFVLVFVLIYAILAKTKVLGESKGINGVISFILGVILMCFSGVGSFVANSAATFAVMISLLFFFFVMIAFVIKDNLIKLTKPLTIVFIILFAIVLIGVIFKSFPSTQAYLPGGSEEGANDFLLSIKYFLLSAKFKNGFLLAVIALIIGFVITKK